MTFIGKTTVDDIMLAIDRLDAADRVKISERLAAKKMDDLRAAADTKRLERLKAAARDRSVPFITAIRSLQRVGLDIEAVAEKADIKAVEAAMTAHNWPNSDRVQLKTVLANIGVIQ
jgi:hypothetical protein